MLLGVPREIADGERRVALVPDAVKSLIDLGLEVAIEASAGLEAGFDDDAYRAAGARVETNADAIFQAGVVAKVRSPAARSDGSDELDRLGKGGLLIGLLQPLDEPGLATRLAHQGVTSFALELIPRITRAQSMDALSSMATISGYRAVLLAAAALPKFFPMLVTAAGTLHPARVLVIGAGVAGLQAIATARRLGAVVEAYDTRLVVKEQVESLGARFVELELDVGDSQDSGGYAKAQSEEFYQRQRDELGKHLAGVDVVITTAAVPGQRAPLLIEENAVRGMRRGSVIVDLAAASGGNCACTDSERDVTAHGVRILSAGQLASDVPGDASRMYAKNVTALVKHLVPDGQLALDFEDEITRGCLLTHEGQIANDRVKALVDGGTA